MSSEAKRNVHWNSKGRDERKSIGAQPSMRIGVSISQ